MASLGPMTEMHMNPASVLAVQIDGLDSVNFRLLIAPLPRRGWDLVVESLVTENILAKSQGWPCLPLSCALIFLSGCWESQDRFSAQLLGLDPEIRCFEGLGNIFSVVQRGLGTGPGGNWENPVKLRSL